MIRYRGSVDRTNRKRRVPLWRAALIVFALTVGPLQAASGDVHSDPIAPVILGVTGILFFAIIGRFGARHFNQPSVFGELLMGVLLGNLDYYFGVELIHHRRVHCRADSARRLL